MNETLERITDAIRNFVLEQKLSDYFTWANKVIAPNKRELEPLKAAFKKYQRLKREKNKNIKGFERKGKQGIITDAEEQVTKVQDEFNEAYATLQREELIPAKMNAGILPKTRYRLKFLGAKVFLTIPVVLMSPIRWAIKKGYQYHQNKEASSINGRRGIGNITKADLEADLARQNEARRVSSNIPSEDDFEILDTTSENKEIEELLNVPPGRLASMYLEQKKAAEDKDKQLLELNKWVVTYRENNKNNILQEAGQLIPATEHEELQTKFKDLLYTTKEMLYAILEPEQIKTIEDRINDKNLSSPIEKEEAIVYSGIKLMHYFNNAPGGKHAVSEEPVSSVTPEQSNVQPVEQPTLEDKSATSSTPNSEIQRQAIDSVLDEINAHNQELINSVGMHP